MGLLSGSVLYTGDCTLDVFRGHHLCFGPDFSADLGPACNSVGEGRNQTLQIQICMLIYMKRTSFISSASCGVHRRFAA